MFGSFRGGEKLLRRELKERPDATNKLFMALLPTFCHCAEHCRVHSPCRSGNYPARTSYYLQRAIVDLEAR